MRADDRVVRPALLMRHRLGPWVTASLLAALIATLATPGVATRLEAGRLSLGRPGLVVPSGFAGFSIEYWTLGHDLGLPHLPANPLLARTLTALGAGRPPQIRIGGNSADATWPAGWPMPPATVRYSVTHAWLSRLAATLRASRSSVMLTLNLAAGRPDAAAALLRRAYAALPRGALRSVAVGNEPDRYPVQAVRLPGGTHTTLRPAGYGLPGILSDERGAIGVLRATGIPFALTGPGFATNRSPTLAGRFLAAHLGLSSYAQHLYALSGCGGARSARRPAELLRPAATDGAVRTIAPALAAARAAAIPLDVQEGNSVSCYGVHGVSDHPYSALWAANLLFDLVRAGVSGYHFHVSGGAYDPFAFRWAGGRWQVRLAPEYFGIAMFEHATAPGARLLRVAGAPPDITAWATRDPRGVTRLLLTNHSLTRGARLSVPARTAHVLALTTGGGLRLGGRSFVSWRPDPRLGLRGLERTVVGLRGRVVVTLPPASADVVQLAPGHR